MVFFSALYFISCSPLATVFCTDSANDDFKMTTQNVQKVDVAIIGAGMALDPRIRLERNSRVY